MQIWVGKIILSKYQINYTLLNNCANGFIFPFAEIGLIVDQNKEFYSDLLKKTNISRFNLTSNFLSPLKSLALLAYKKFILRKSAVPKITKTFKHLHFFEKESRFKYEISQVKSYFNLLQFNSKFVLKMVYANLKRSGVVFKIFIFFLSKEKKMPQNAKKNTFYSKISLKF